MNLRRLVMILIPMVLVFGIVAGYFWGMPRLVQVSPGNDARAVFADASLRLVFSRPMRTDSVTERLEINPPQDGSFTWEGSTLVFTPAQPWPSGEMVTVSLASGARTAGLLSLPLSQDVTWSFTIRHPQLVYLFPASGPSNLYTTDPVTGESQQLTDYVGSVSEFNISNGGRLIYFSLDNGKEGSAIYRLSLSGGGTAPDQEQPNQPELVLECPQALCRAPKTSPQGDFLAYERSALAGSDGPAFPQVWLLPLQSGDASGTAQPENLTPFLAGDPDHQTLQPDWSSTGLLTFYDTHLSAFVIQDPRSKETRLFPNQTGQPGSWQPDGQYYIAPEISTVEATAPRLTGPDAIANSHLLRFNIQTSKAQDLSSTANLEDASPAFSPDGRYLAFARKFLDIERWTPGRQLWLMRPDGSDAHPLTNDPFFNHYEFAWSPDSSLLAFVRFNQTVMTEPPEIWVIDPATTRANRLVIGGYAPQWIP